MSVGVYDPDQQCLEPVRSVGTRSSREEVYRSMATVTVEEDRVLVARQDGSVAGEGGRSVID